MVDPVAPAEDPESAVPAVSTETVSEAGISESIPRKLGLLGSYEVCETVDEDSPDELPCLKKKVGLEFNGPVNTIKVMLG